MAIMTDQVQLQHAINWVHAALQACEVTGIEACDPVIAPLIAFTIARGGAPFLDAGGAVQDFPTRNRTWGEPIFGTIFYSDHFKKTDLFVFKELKHYGIKGIAANRSPFTGNNYCDEIRPFLVSMLERLDLSDCCHAMATWACCRALMLGNKSPYQCASGLLERFSNERTQPRALLPEVMPATGRLFLELIDAAHPGARYLNRVLGFELAPESGLELPAFGLT